MNKIRIGIITQDDPFYLFESLEHLFNITPNEKYEYCFAIVTSASPFGRKTNYIKKIIETFKVFGFSFFINYSYRYFVRRVILPKGIDRLFEKKNIPLINNVENINSEKVRNEIEKFKPDVILSILGNQIFKKEIIKIPKIGTLNLHTSLLPAYRGLMPTFWVLKNNEEYTGVTVHLIDEGIDTGNIVVQRKIKIGNMSQRELIIKSKLIGMEAIIEALDKASSGTNNFISNEQLKESYFGFPTRADVKEFYKNGKKFY